MLVSLRVDARAPRRLPKQIYPHALEAEYGTHLVGIVARARAAYADVVRDAPGIVAAARAERGDARLDAGHGARLRSLITDAAHRLEVGTNVGELEVLARRYGRAASDHQKAQLARQMRAAVGVDPILKEPGLASRMDAFAQQNASLIKSIQRGYHGEIEKLSMQALTSGRGTEDLAGEITDRFGVGERHARLIARDQVGKLTGQLNASRQRELGISKFTWTTAGDERVRDEHVELDGKVFDYDDPPDEGLPGEPICCRCTAEPVFEDDDDGEDASEE